MSFFDMDSSTFGILYFIFVISSITFWHGHQFKKLFNKNETTEVPPSPTTLPTFPENIDFQMDISAGGSARTCEALISGRKCGIENTLACDTNCYLKVLDCIGADGENETKWCCCKDPNELVDRRSKVKS